MPPAVVAAIAAACWLQHSTPYKKSDLVRLLSTSLAPAEIADLVQRRCVSFIPSARDKEDLRALGADEQLLRRLDECARKLATVRPAPLTVAPARTGFVSGTGQRGRVGTRLALPLVFEVRDTANRPVPARALTLSGYHARVEPTQAVTDSNGRVVAFVTLGQQAGPAHVAAKLGQIERQAPLVALPGPPASVAVRCAATDVGDRLALGIADHDLGVAVLDAFGNEVPLSDLRVTAGDTRTLHPAVTTNAVVVRGLRGGQTKLVVEAAGLRRSIAVVVDPAGGSATACRRSVPGG